jgi:fructuronate reductase
VIDRLSAATLSRLPKTVRAPDYDFSRLPVGIVHLGVGAFHRAHQALYVEDALRAGGGAWGILGAALRHAEVPAALRAQDGLYAVEVLDEPGRYRVVGALRGALSAPADGLRLLEALASPDTHLCTLTVTEKGYCLDVAGQLDLAHPDIARDLRAPDAPVCAVGWLAAALRRRARHGAPLTVISCDNLKNNGARLEGAVCAFLDRTHPEILPFVRREVRFPRTVVDCIVPAASVASRARVREALGLEDLASVQREPYSQWVIENNFAGPRPAFERVGVELVADPADHGRLKLHVLNTCHSALAYLGLPRGHKLVREAVADGPLAQFLEDLVALEVTPALGSLPVADYWRGVRLRFANPRIDYQLRQIAEDGAQKLTERVFPLMQQNLQSGAPILRLARIVAGWLRHVGLPVDAALADHALLPEALRTSEQVRRALADGA